MQGFKKIVDAHNASNPAAKIEVVSELPSRANRTDSYKATADTLQAHEDLAAIFAINDPAALGAYTAVQEKSLENSIKIIGFDGQKEGKVAIKEGKIYADPIQFPDQMGCRSSKISLLT